MSLFPRSCFQHVAFPHTPASPTTRDISIIDLKPQDPNWTLSFRRIRSSGKKRNSYMSWCGLLSGSSNAWYHPLSACCGRLELWFRVKHEGPRCTKFSLSKRVSRNGRTFKEVLSLYRKASVLIPYYPLLPHPLHYPLSASPTGGRSFQLLKTSFHVLLLLLCFGI